MLLVVRLQYFLNEEDSQRLLMTIRWESVEVIHHVGCGWNEHNMFFRKLVVKDGPSFMNCHRFQSAEFQVGCFEAYRNSDRNVLHCHRSVIMEITLMKYS